jgi:hypothetical protein
MMFTLLVTVGGMTGIELGVLLDTSGPELFLVVARYKESEHERKRSLAAILSLSEDESVPLHWNDVGLDRTPTDCSKMGQLTFDKNTGPELVQTIRQKVNEEMTEEKTLDVNGNGNGNEELRVDTFDMKLKIQDLELKVSARLIMWTLHNLLMSKTF